MYSQSNELRQSRTHSWHCTHPLRATVAESSMTPRFKIRDKATLELKAKQLGIVMHGSAAMKEMQI